MVTDVATDSRDTGGCLSLNVYLSGRLEHLYVRMDKKASGQRANRLGIRKEQHEPHRERPFTSRNPLCIRVGNPWYLIMTKSSILQCKCLALPEQTLMTYLITKKHTHAHKVEQI